MDGRLRSNGVLDFDEFTSLMHRLLSLSWGDEWGSFTEEFPTTTDSENIAYPIITYSIERITPGRIGKETREIKPRHRSYYKDENSNEIIETFGQVLDYEIEFQLFEENNKKLMELHKRFRDFMKTYTGYFMKNGVKTILFMNMSKKEQNLRDVSVSRSYLYLVQLEELTEVPRAELEQIFHRMREEE